VVLAGSLTEPEADSPPSSPYAAAKLAASAYARMFHHLYGTPIVIVRPFMTYGPRQDPEKLIPYVILTVLQGSRPKLGSGEWKADWVYVDDVIDGFIEAARTPNVDGSSIDLGSGTLVSARSIVAELVELIDPRIEPEWAALPDRPSERIRVADVDDAYAKLGWRASVSLREGLERTIAWYRAREGGRQRSN
jgi:UDP-glucose 4-epimerase